MLTVVDRDSTQQLFYGDKYSVICRYQKLIKHVNQTYNFKKNNIINYYNVFFNKNYLNKQEPSFIKKYIKPYHPTLNFNIPIFFPNNTPNISSKLSNVDKNTYYNKYSNISLTNSGLGTNDLSLYESINISNFINNKVPMTLNTKLKFLKKDINLLRIFVKYKNNSMSHKLQKITPSIFTGSKSQTYINNNLNTQSISSPYHHNIYSCIKYIFKSKYIYKYLSINTGTNSVNHLHKIRKNYINNILYNYLRISRYYINKRNSKVFFKENPPVFSPSKTINTLKISTKNISNIFLYKSKKNINYIQNFKRKLYLLLLNKKANKNLYLYTTNLKQPLDFNVKKSSRLFKLNTTSITNFTKYFKKNYHTSLRGYEYLNYKALDVLEIKNFFLLKRFNNFILGRNNSSSNRRRYTALLNTSKNNTITNLLSRSSHTYRNINKFSKSYPNDSTFILKYAFSNQRHPICKNSNKYFKLSNLR